MVQRGLVSTKLRRKGARTALSVGIGNPLKPPTHEGSPSTRVGRERTTTAPPTDPSDSPNKIHILYLIHNNRSCPHNRSIRSTPQDTHPHGFQCHTYQTPTPNGTQHNSKKEPLRTFPFSADWWEGGAFIKSLSRQRVFLGKYSFSEKVRK